MSPFESGVQARYRPLIFVMSTPAIATSNSANTRSRPPRCGMRTSKSLGAEADRRRKAMVRPSGDQAGLKSSAGSLVNGDRAVPRRSA